MSIAYPRTIQCTSTCADNIDKFTNVLHRFLSMFVPL